MKKQNNKTTKVFLSFTILFLMLLSPIAFAETYSRTNPQFSQPLSSATYLERQGVSLTPRFDEGKCEAGQDFVLQIDPAGCSPSVVPSPLLEDQNVPIFCPIMATKINPLIDVDAIKNLKFSFNGTKPKEIAGIAYHPARAALRVNDKLLNSPILENVGYAVINLAQQKNETAMPEWIEGDLNVEIQYDIKNAFGIGKGTFYLSEMDNQEWSSDYIYYGFWNNKFFLRAEDIGKDGARIAIYSSEDLRHASANIPEGKTSETLYLPGQYCKAGVELKLESLNHPGTRVKLLVDNDIIEVVEGEKFLDNKCSIKNIDTSKEIVTISCSGADKKSKSFTLDLNSKRTIPKEKEDDYKKAIQYYEQVADDYPEEKVLEGLEGYGYYYGEQALIEAINLANKYNQVQDVILLNSKLKSLYGRTYNPVEIKDNTPVSIGGTQKSISLLKIIEASKEDYNVKGTLDNEEFELGKENSKEVKGVIINLEKLTDTSATFKFTNRDKSQTIIVKEGELKEFKLNGQSHNVYVSKININKIAKVSVIPKINYAKTNTPLHFKIGIDKRDIKLSDDKIKERIADLNKTIEEWQEKSEQLGKVVEGLKGACLVTGAFLTIKNVFWNLKGGTTARQYAMRGVNGDGGVASWCALNSGSDKQWKTPEECVSKNGALIEELAEINKEIIDAQQTKLKELRENNLLKGASTFPGEKVVDNYEYKEDYTKYINTKYINTKYKKNINPDLTSIDKLRQIEYNELLTAKLSTASDNAQKIISGETGNQDKLLQGIIGDSPQTDNGASILGNFSNGEELKVSFFDRAPNENVPAIVPLKPCIDGKDFGGDGWYVGTKYSLTGTTHESGAPKNIYLCNVGSNNKIEFNPQTGSPGTDECGLINSDFSIPKDFSLPGIDNTKTKNLFDHASSAYRQVSANYNKGASEVRYCGQNIKIDTIANIPQQMCEDFMSPKDCKILFNVCDPVVCPSSRCNFGGKYYMTDVIQSGIIGSTFACLNNFVGFKGDVVIPVCLTGIHAGIEGLLSVFKSYRDCLQHRLETGENIGFCDEIYSIQLCDFFWKQLAPIADIIIPKALEFATGQFVTGGGEYKSVQAAWQNAENSLNYFTQYYAVNAFKMFKAKSINEVGSEICQNSLSTTYPSGDSFLDTLTEAVSPPQFHGWLDYSLHTSASVPPTYQYNIFYHIYAGTENDEIAYLVYLRSSDTGLKSGEVYSGKLEKGAYATNKLDYTGPAGYNEICIVVGTQEKCGFKRVSTSFALDYVQDEYVKQQASQKNIASEKECTSGSSSAYSFVNPNLQSGSQNFLNPDLRGLGITRVCSTQNPGEGTNPNRWKEVGHCGDTKMKCWLDTKSVNEAASLERIDEKGLMGEIEELTKEQFDELYYDTPASSELLKDIEKAIEGNYTAGNETGLRDTIKRIEFIENGKDECKRFFYDSQNAGLLLLKARAYKYIVFLGDNNENKNNGSESNGGEEGNGDGSNGGDGVNGEDIKQNEIKTRIIPLKERNEVQVKTKIDDTDPCYKYIGMMYDNNNNFKYSKYDIKDPLLLISVMKQESNCNINHEHQDGKSFGLMGLTEPTVNEICLEKISEINSFEDIKGQANVMKHMECGAKILGTKYNLFQHACDEKSEICNHPFGTSATENRKTYCLGNACLYRYKCENVDEHYSGWEAGLRAYNGWSCTGGNLNYVEDVLEKWESLSYEEIREDIFVVGEDGQFLEDYYSGELSCEQKCKDEYGDTYGDENVKWLEDNGVGCYNRIKPIFPLRTIGDNCCCYTPCDSDSNEKDCLKIRDDQPTN